MRLKCPLPRAEERPRDDAADVVLAAHQLARDRADAPQLLDRNDLLVRRDLEDGVGRGVDDRRAGAHVLFAELVEDHRPRRRLVAERLPADAPLVFGDDVGRKSVRIGAERILDDEPHHFPMPGRRVLPRADLGHPPERAARRLGRCRLRKRVQQPEPREGRQRRMLRVEHVAERVRALVAEVFRVRQLADAEGVTDDDDGAISHAFFFFGLRAEAVLALIIRRSSTIEYVGPHETLPLPAPSA